MLGEPDRINLGIPTPGTQLRPVALPEVLNTILYQARSGCLWDMLPHELPPKSTVYDHSARWRDAKGCRAPKSQEARDPTLARSREVRIGRRARGQAIAATAERAASIEAARWSPMASPSARTTVMSVMPRKPKRPRR
jgi:transposase